MPIHDNTASNFQTCPVCDKAFSSVSNMKRHQRQHSNADISCQTCGKKFSRSDKLLKHKRVHHVDPEPKANHLKFRCHLCPKNFGFMRNLQRHLQTLHKNEELMGSSIEPAPKPEPIPTPTPPRDPTQPQSYVTGVPRIFQNLYRRHWRYIRTREWRSGRYNKHYNFRIQNCSVAELVSLAETVFRKQKDQFKMDVSIGLVLVHKLTKQQRYYYPEKNNSLLKAPKLMGTEQDLQMLKAELNGINLFEHGRLERPDTSYTVECVSNVLFTVYGLERPPIGAPGQSPSEQSGTSRAICYQLESDDSPLRTPGPSHTEQSDENDIWYQNEVNDPDPLFLDSEEDSDNDEEHQSTASPSIDPQASKTVRQYIRNKRSILSFERNHNGNAYLDHLCFFRCLYSRKTSFTTRGPQARVNDLLKSWCNATGNPSTPTEFRGINLCDIPKLEEHFKTRILIYKIDLVGADHENPIDDDGDLNDLIVEYHERRQDDGSSDNEDEAEVPDRFAASLVYRSTKKFKDILHLNLFEDHFSLIKNINKYCDSYRCEFCDKIFTRSYDYTRHTTKCTVEIKKVYPGGGFAAKPTIFEKLENMGVHIPVADRMYPFYGVYDFECVLSPKETPGDGKLKYTHTCIPASVSLAHNVTDDPQATFSEPIFHLNESPQDLIRDFYLSLEQMAAMAYERMREKFLDIILEMERKVSLVSGTRRELKRLKRERAPEEEIEMMENLLAEAKEWEPLHQQFSRWLKQFPIIGFNSGSFDLNLIRQHFIPYLMKNEIKIDSPVVRGSSYMMIATENLLFLDMINYLAAGTSYKKFLETFEVGEEKGVFPYQWFTSVEKLFSTTELPPKECFYSDLKNEGITDAEYQDLQGTWEDKGFRNMRDLLEWYNNKDVMPFLKAIAKIRQIFVNMGLDMFKENCISLPGLALKYMNKNRPPDQYFCLFDEKHKDIRDAMVSNIVGGPSIVFNRMAHAGYSNIGPGGPRCKSIKGLDANAQYLGCVGKHMPTGIPAIWEPVEGSPDALDMPTHGDPNDVFDQINKDNILKHNIQNMRFQRKFMTYGYKEIAWVTYKFKEIQATYPNRTISLKHRFNGGQKTFRFGRKRIPVDGYIPELDTILQFHGCYYHGHDCNLTTNVPETEKREKDSRTRNVKNLLETTGCQIVEMRECELHRELRTNSNLQDHYNNHKLPGLPNCCGANLLDSVEAGHIEIPNIEARDVFGIMEVDIQVPWWKPDLREKMKELPPIFKNAEVSIDDIGPTMAEFAREHNLMTKPRRCLISSYHATKIMVATPLLSYYIRLGLQVTRIYRFIQYHPQKVFSHLVDEIANYRRQADLNPSTKPLAETYKKIGNSMYGKYLTRVDRHLQVSYTWEDQVQNFIASPSFRKLVYIGKKAYEVHMAKKRVVYDLPIEIPLFVYQYAKLSMLDFYYGFLKKVLGNNFMLMEMDTDSFYIALAGHTLEEALVDRDLYDEIKEEYLPFTDYDQRTPLLFKEEWSGDSMVCLSAKTYIGWEQGGQRSKVTCKGISKRTTKYTYRDYLKALRQKQTVAGTNYGFQMVRTQLCQYKQVRNGLGFFYAKRKVLPNGIHTEPLDI